MGAKGKPFYRLVVKEKRSKRDGKYLENLGTYDPMLDPAEVNLEPRPHPVLDRRRSTADRYGQEPDQEQPGSGRTGIARESSATLRTF